MKITGIQVDQANLPIEYPYWLSCGRLRCERADATLGWLETDKGPISWSEGAPWGRTYVAVHGPGIRAGIETIASVILGLDPSRVLDGERAMDLAPPGHSSIKSPIGTARWDVAGQAASMRIADPMGGQPRLSIAFRRGENLMSSPGLNEDTRP